ncbi:MAG: MFS transporter, partial [Oligoflexia bacterium]|nr:MFS transporter [Oligoflexia bacterium]
MNNQKRNLMMIFFVILADITGFGMVIPLTPILARDFGAEGLKIGLLISCYSFVQFLFAPFWGRLSDAFGRKSVILIGLFGSSLAHLLFAFSNDFNDIFVSRLLAGFFGGNVVIATAYIADISSQINRSKSLALIGMAFGAGFTIGPLLGFLFILLGSHFGATPPFGAHFASIGASFLCFVNFILAFLFLKESLSQRKQLTELFKKNSFFKRPSLYLLWESLKTPKLGLVLIMSFILWFSLAQIEPVLILLVQDDFSWDKKTAYSSFIYIGLLMILSQGYLVRKWIPRWGENLVNR